MLKKQQMIVSITSIIENKPVTEYLGAKNVVDINLDYETLASKVRILMLKTSITAVKL